MKRYEVLGAYKACHQRLEDVAESVRNIEERFYGVGNYPPECNQRFMRWGDLMECCDFATLTHLGYYDSTPDVAEYCRKAVEIALDFFYGDYRNHGESIEIFERSPSNEALKWAGIYRDGLFFALLMEDSEATNKLSEWIAPWLPYDETEYDFKREDNYYHMVLAAWLSQQGTSTDEIEAKIVNSRPRRPKLLLNTLLAIKDRDSNTFGARLKDFLKYYMKSGMTGESISSWFSIEASILWHVAKREKLDLPDLDQKPAALIMTLETLGITG